MCKETRRNLRQINVTYKKYMYTCVFDGILCKKYSHVLFRRLLDRVPPYNIIQCWLQLFTGIFHLLYNMQLCIYIILIFNYLHLNSPGSSLVVTYSTCSYRGTFSTERVTLKLIFTIRLYH